MRLLKVIVALAILAFAGLAGYAYLGDMAPQRQELRVPVTLENGGATAGRASPTAPAAPPAEPEAATETPPEPTTSDAPAPADAEAAPAAGADALD